MRPGAAPVTDRPDFPPDAAASPEPERQWSQYAALLAVLVSVLLWASAFVGIRSAARELSPGPLSLGRLLVGLVALIAVCGIRRERWPAGRDLRAVAPALVMCGVIWFGVYNLALNAGERHVDAGTAAMIVYISPVLIAVFAGLFLGEGFSRSLFAGCAVSFLGVAIIALASAARAATTFGVILCLIAAVSLASGAITQKVVLRRLSGLQTITACCAIGVAMLLPFAPALVREVGTASTGSVLWTVYLGIFPTAIGFLTWAFALSRSDAGRLGVTIYLVPAVSVVLAWLILGETPRPLALFGGLLCLAGVAVSRGLSLRRLRRSDHQVAVAEATTRPDNAPYPPRPLATAGAQTLVAARRKENS
jgi:drug/metabolite transporter (DMT)-like permease